MMYLLVHDGNQELLVHCEWSSSDAVRGLVTRITDGVDEAKIAHSVRDSLGITSGQRAWSSCVPCL